jgi:hypothetical protein
VLNRGFADALEIARFFEDTHNIPAFEKLTPINLGHQFAGNLSRGSDYMPASKTITWRIQAMTNLLDQVVAVMKLVNHPRAAFSSAICLRISVSCWSILIGIMNFIVTE